MELVLVITVIGVLAIVALPKVVNIQDEAKAAQRDGIAGRIRSGIKMQFSNAITTTNSVTYPATLDSASDGACAPSNLCFDVVLQDGISKGWTKAGFVYTHTGTGTVYTYTPATGFFE